MRKCIPDFRKRSKNTGRRGSVSSATPIPIWSRGASFSRKLWKKTYFVKNEDGSICLVDFGEFDCGIPDLTDPEAYEVV